MNWIERYPALFKQDRRPWNGTPSTGPGWDQLLIDLFDAMVTLSDPPLVLQVKEKFGGLKVYTSRVEPQVDQWIREAEHTASVTCEQCGQSGEMRDGSWLKTLCEGCEEKRQAKRGH